MDRPVDQRGVHQVDGRYPYSYAYPYATYSVYRDPIYVRAAPVYQPQTQLSVAPSFQREVCYTGGCYHLQGDGVTDRASGAPGSTSSPG